MNIIQSIKSFFVVKRFIETEIQEAKKMDGTKPGWKTTEFWFNLAGQIGTVWAAVQGLIPGKVAAIISISGIAIYTVARTVVKAIADVKAASAPTPAA